MAAFRADPVPEGFEPWTPDAPPAGFEPFDPEQDAKDRAQFAKGVRPESRLVSDLKNADKDKARGIQVEERSRATVLKARKPTDFNPDADEISAADSFAGTEEAKQAALHPERDLGGEVEKGFGVGWDATLAMMRQNRADFAITVHGPTKELLEASRKAKAEADAFNAQMPDSDIAQAAYNVGNLAASMFSSGKQAAKAAAAGAAVGAAGGAAAGAPAGGVGAVPGAIVGGISGGVVGLTGGFAADSYITNAGQIMGDLREAGVDPAIAKRAGMVGGSIMAALDLVGVGFAARPFVKAAERKAVQKVIASELEKGALREAGKDYLVGIAGETAAETTQQIVQDVATDIAKQADGKDYQTIFNDPKRRHEVVMNAVHTAIATAEGMAVLGAPGAALTLARKAPIAGRSYTPEDAVQELGMTPEEASAQFGKDSPFPPLELTKDMERGAPMVTPDDHASPLPTDLIQQGKGAIAGDLELGSHNDVLRANGLPEVGKRVTLDRGPFGQSTGTMRGTFDVGGEKGVSVGLDDGSTYEELLRDMQQGGHSIQELIDKYLPETPTNAAGSASPAVAPETTSEAPIAAERGGIAARDALKARIRSAESSGDDQVRNPRSTASGRYQFTDSTWAQLGGDPAKKNDPAEQERLMDKLTSQNEGALRHAGIEPTAGNLYLAHFLGAGGAINAIHKPNDQVSAKVQAANPFAKGWTNAELAAWADKKMGGEGRFYLGAGSDLQSADEEQSKPREEIQFTEQKVPEEEQAQAESKPFDSEEFDRTRNETIAASKAAGNKHLDDLEPAVETMRGKPIYYAHDPKITGTVRTVANTGEVVVHWNDRYSADKEMATERGGKFESWLGPRDLKDYVVGAPSSERTEAAPTPHLSKQDQLKAKIEASRAPAAAEQPDMFGGPTKTAAQMDAQAKAPAIIEEAKQNNRLDDLHDAVDYVLNRAPNSPHNETESAAREFRNAVGDPSLSNREVHAYAAEIDRLQNPDAQKGEDQPEWVQFGPNSGTLGIPRAEMPQVKGKHRGAMVNFLQAKGITTKEETVPAGTLKPSQAEYSPAKVASWDKGNVKLEERAILVSSDNHILDGHHQWVKAKQQGEDLRVIRLNVPAREALAAMHEFPSSHVSEGATSGIQQNPVESGVPLPVHLPLDTDGKQVVLLPSATDEERARVAKALEHQKVKGIKRKDGAIVYPQRVADHIKSALNELRDLPLTEAGKKQLEDARAEMPEGHKLRIDGNGAVVHERPDGTISRHLRFGDRGDAIGGSLRNVVSTAKFSEEQRQQREAKEPTADQPSEAPASIASAEALREKATPHQEELVAWGKRWERQGDEYGFINPGMKSVERIAEKFAKEGYQSFDEIKDAARIGFKITDRNKATDLAVSAQRTFGAENVTDKGWQMVDGDYFDRKLVIAWPDGIKAEVQIIPDAIEEYRHKGKRDGYEGEGAELYKEWRKLHRDGDPRTAEVLAKMEAGYANAVAGTSWESFFNELKSARGNALRASASESRTPTLDTSPGAGPQRSADDQTSAQPRPETEPSATKRSSISNNEKSAIESHIGSKGYGANNRLVTRERAEELRAKLRAKLGTQLNSGIDPEILAAGTELAVFHIEAGARKFADFAKAMVADLSLTAEQAKRLLRGWYNGARDMMEDAGAPVGDMDKALSQEEAQAILAFGILRGELATESQSGTLPTEEQSNAGATENGSSGADDRAGDAGRSAGDLPRAEGSRNAVGGPEEQGRGSGAELSGRTRGSDHEGSALEPAAAGAERAAGGAPEQRGERGDSASGRVRGKRANRGTDFRASPGDLKRSGSWKATAERNLEIVALVRQLEAEGRPATPDEQKLLAKFTGWGASEIRNNLFRNVPANATEIPEPPSWRTDEWVPLVKKARELLTGSDLTEALQSVQYAHYTGEDVVRPIWAAMERLGFKGGNIIEPGMGIGNFFIAAPEAIQDGSKYTGVELDGFTAKIAKYLLPQENVIHGDYVKTPFPNGFFDAAVGNPPFANIKILDDPAYKRNRFSLHDYFLAKTIDKVRPGGVLVFVTSRYTMDKLDRKMRAYVSDKAKLLGAIRLPQTAFKENAGTEVVTDILFFQRKTGLQDDGPVSWIDTRPITAGGHQFQINEYFKEHPEMVLGKHSSQGSMYRANEYTVEPYASKKIDALMAEAVKQLPQDVYSKAVQSDVEAAKAKTFERDFAPASSKEGGLYWNDKGLFVREQGSGVPVEAISTKKLTPADHQWLKSYTKLRDALKVAQKDQLTDGEWEKSLAALNKEYQGFVKKHGRLLAFTAYERTIKADEDGEEKTVSYKRYHNQRLFDLDVESPLIQQLEKITDDDEIVEGAFLKGRTLNKPTRPIISSAQDALAVTLDETGKVDLDYAAKLFDTSREELVSALGDGVFESPSEGWQTSDAYLSGDVLAKLEEAEAAAKLDSKYERNVQALIKVQPKPLTADQINVKLGAGWITEDVIRKFAEDELGVDGSSITYEPATGSWQVDTKGTRYLRHRISDYGTSDRSPIELLDALLNNRPLKITRTVNDGGSKKTITDEKATAAAQEAAQKIGDRFKAWIWTDAKRAKSLTDIYNRRFNNLAPRSFNGDHLTLPGLSANFKPHPHVKRAVWRIIQSGNTYLGHAVGAGKTAEQIISAMEQKRLGLIKKPMFVVPNHMLNQFAGEFLELYPAANIMVADEAAFHTGNRRRFMAQAALNDPDAIIVTHSSFGKLETQQETRDIVVDDMIAEMEAALEDAKRGDNSRIAVRDLQNRIEKLKRRFAGKQAAGKDKALTFEEMGVDFLYVDEAHEFRKLDFSTAQQVKGISPEGSQKALDLFIKTRWLEQQNPGRSLVLASGTPVTNTMAELYTVMRYMDQKGLERDGLASFDAWANMFGEIVEGYERNAAGKYESVTRFAKFVNVPELMKRVRTFMDVLTSDQLGGLVQRPAIKGKVPANEIVEPSAMLKTYMEQTLDARIKTSREWKPSPQQPGNPDPLINIITDARLASIDARFFQPSLANDPQSKLNAMLDKIIAKHAEFKDTVYVDPKTGVKELNKGAVQIVFSAVGFGEEASTNRGFDIKGWINKRLIEGGIKKSEIAWMSDANSHSKKEALQKAVRAGTVKVLIGSPKNMGTGLNVQRRLKVLHYLSPPWYPSDVEQPHGRIIRQGNLNPEVEIYWYATKGTYDSTQWGMVSRKQKFIEQALAGDDSVRTLEDISEASQYEMAAALAAGDDRVIQIAAMSADIERLKRLKGAHGDQQRELAHEQRQIEKYIPKVEAEIAAIAEADKARGTGFQPFSVTVGKTVFDKHGEAGKALIEAADQHDGSKEVELGKLYGQHPIVIIPARYGFQIGVKVGGYELAATEAVDKAESLDPTGLSQRLQNKVQSIPSLLASERQQLKNDQARLKEIGAKLGAPFEYESDLNEKIAERANLQEELARENNNSPADGNAPIQTDGTTGTLQSAGPAMGRRDFLKGATAVAGGFMFHGKLYATPAGLTSILDKSTKGAIPAAQAVQWLAENSSNPVYRQVAKKLVPLVSGTRLRSVEFEEVGTIGGGEKLYGGIYRGSDQDSVTVPSEMSLGTAHGVTFTGENGEDQIWLAKTSRERELDGWNEATVIHEALHSAILRYYGMLSVRAPNPRAQLEADGYDREAFPRSDKADAAIEEIRSIWKDAVARWKAQGEGIDAKNTDGKPLSAASVGRIENGLSNTDEFIAYALADPDIQDFLKQMPTGHDSRSLWQRFVDAIRSMFGFGTVSRSALNDVMDATNRLLDEVQGQPAVPPGRANREKADSLKDAGTPIEPSGPEFDPESEARWKEATKGIGSGPGMVEKAKGWWDDLRAGFTRHWRDLPNEPRFSAVQQKLRQLEAAHDSALEETVRHLRDLVGKLNQEDRDLLARKVVLDDLMWEADREHELPFGFTPSTLAEARARIDSILQTKPQVTDAVRKRKAVNRQLADDMVKAGVLTPEQVKNPAYFRHMVLDFARAEARLARGGKVKSPYWAKRMGSSLDINANLLEAEFDWMMKARVDIATANTISWIKTSEHNIRERLRQQAKDSNKEKMAAVIASNEEARKLDGKLRSNVARGMAYVKDEIAAGHVVPPPHLEAAADALIDGSQDSNVFPLLSWILDDDQPGAMGAAMVLNAIGRRKAFEKAALGREWIDADDVQGLVDHYKPEGYSAWQPREGQHLFTAKTVSEHTLDMFVDKLASGTKYPGISEEELTAALGAIKPQLVVGGQRYTMVVPSELAQTLDGYGDRRAAGMVAQIFGEIQSAWKRWVLINPRRFFKYNLNNMSGDLDAIIAGKPASLLKVPHAASELYRVWRGKEQPSEAYKEALERGVFTSGLSAQEIPDINKLSGMHHLLTAKSLRPDRFFMQTVANVWHALQGFTNFREATFRYAAYLKFKEELDAGKEQAKIGYGASVPNMVDAVSDHADKAALMARDLVGDYGSISAAGSWLRRYLIPFWSWTEINTKRYWRLTANVYHATRAGGIGAGSKSFAKLAVSGTLTGAMLLVRMGLMFALINLWNHLLFGDDEDKLTDEQQRQLHLILGKDANGEIATIRLQGALSDVLGTFGFPDAVAAMKRYQDGQGTIGQAVMDMVKAPVNRVATSVTPIFSTPFEQALGQEFWPDLFNPRQIHDRWRHLFQTFNLENEYDALAKKPSRGYARSWTESVVYRRDPGEMSYDEARSIAFDWLHDVKGEASKTFGESPRSEALREYKLALRYGDQDAARKALETYAKYGGTRKGLKLSEKAANPLHAIPKKYRREFVNGLTDEQLQTFRDAEDWYKETYLGR